jgi:hypothetical protein
VEPAKLCAETIEGLATMPNQGDGLGRRIFESMSIGLEMDPEGTMGKFPVVNEVAFGGREIDEIRAGVAGAA